MVVVVVVYFQLHSRFIVIISYPRTVVIAIVFTV